MDVVIATDAPGLIGAKVAIASLMKAMPESVRLTILCHGMVAASTMTEHTRDYSHVKIVTFERAALSDIKLPAHLPFASLLRLCAVDHLDETISRFVYIDNDTVTVKPFLELADIDLEGKILAAAPDGLIDSRVRVFHEEQIPKRLEYVDKYFNSGVLVVDRNQWNSNRVSSRTLDLLRNERFDYGDQDALNIVLQDEWKELHPKYNLQSSFVFPSVQNAVLAQDSNSVLSEAIRSPSIIHYNGPHKPWNSSGEFAHPLESHWHLVKDRVD
jgi:lipopolysaccharide biosynthesis glycosyltransferase